MLDMAGIRIDRSTTTTTAISGTSTTTSTTTSTVSPFVYTPASTTGSTP